MMTLAQEGYSIMKEMPSWQLMPFIQLLKMMRRNDDEEGVQEKKAAFAEMNTLRLKCAAELPEDFDPEKEYAEALEQRYGYID